MLTAQLERGFVILPFNSQHVQCADSTTTNSILLLCLRKSTRLHKIKLDNGMLQVVSFWKISKIIWKPHKTKDESNIKQMHDDAKTQFTQKLIQVTNSVIWIMHHEKWFLTRSVSKNYDVVILLSQECVYNQVLTLMSRAFFYMTDSKQCVCESQLLKLERLFKNSSLQHSSSIL